jgi:hypothetical protein
MLRGLVIRHNVMMTFQFRKIGEFWLAQLIDDDNDNDNDNDYQLQKMPIVQDRPRQA